jgi:hypothetical protein
MVGIMGGQVTGVPLSEVAEGKKTPDSELMELASVLAR